MKIERMKINNIPDFYTEEQLDYYKNWLDKIIK